MILSNPTKLLLPSDDESVRNFLTFHDRSVDYQIQKMGKNIRWKRNNPDSYFERLDELKASRKKCILFHDEDGAPWTFSGLWQDLQQRFGWTLRPNPSEESSSTLPWVAIPHEMRYYQRDAVEALLKARHAAIELPTACHLAGTPILLFNGSIKKVEDIRVGDRLMGPDSCPRTVLRLYNGQDDLYTITPDRGEVRVVNSQHVLALRRTNTKSSYRTNTPRRKDFMGTHPTVNCTVQEYLAQSKTFKHTYKLYHTGVEFGNSQPLSIPPYILGLWLGDGSSSEGSLTTMDGEIAGIWTRYIRSVDGEVHITQQLNNRASTFRAVAKVRKGPHFSNPMTGLLRNINVLRNKHIPMIYKTSNQTDRLALLAGLIDTDGYYAGSSYEITQKSPQLADDILFLARSLGFSANRTISYKKCQTGNGGYYHRIHICGDIARIPVLLVRKKSTGISTRKNPLVSGFKVSDYGYGEYYGFELDGDHLYLDGSFMVHHNSGKTRIIMELLKRTARKSLIVTPSSAITEQIYDELVKFFGSKYVGQYGNGKKQYKQLFTVATLQALLRLDPNSEIFDALAASEVFIGDEAHCLPPDAFQSVCTGVAAQAPDRFFLSATQLRTDGSQMVLRGITGPIVYKKEYQELVQEGYVARMFFHTFRVPSYGPLSDDPGKETRTQLYCNPNVNRLAADLANKSVTLLNRPTVMIIEEFKQFLQLKNYLNVPFEFVHGGTSKDVKDVLPQEYWKCDTKGAVERFNEGKIKLLIGTSAISVGVDLRPIQCLMYLQGDSSEVKVRQAIGRGARMPPGKKDCTVIDFNVDDSQVVLSGSQERVRQGIMQRHYLARKVIYDTMGTVTEHG